jgi:hypothetical protein
MKGIQKSIQAHIIGAQKRTTVQLGTLFKGTESRDEYFLKAYKMNLHFMYMRRWFLKF